MPPKKRRDISPESTQESSDATQQSFIEKSTKPKSPNTYEHRYLKMTGELKTMTVGSYKLRDCGNRSGKPARGGTRAKSEPGPSRRPKTAKQTPTSLAESPSDESDYVNMSPPRGKQTKKTKPRKKALSFGNSSVKLKDPKNWTAVGPTSADGSSGEPDSDSEAAEKKKAPKKKKAVSSVKTPKGKKRGN